MNLNKVCGIGYNAVDFFLKMKKTEPLMGAKLKSKTHLQNTFIDFLYVLLAFFLNFECKCKRQLKKTESLF
jgi:hypothetical protein